MAMKTPTALSSTSDSNSSSRAKKATKPIEKKLPCLPPHSKQHPFPADIPTSGTYTTQLIAIRARRMPAGFDCLGILLLAGAASSTVRHFLYLPGMLRLHTLDLADFHLSLQRHYLDIEFVFFPKAMEYQAFFLSLFMEAGDVFLRFAQSGLERFSSSFRLLDSRLERFGPI